MSETGNGCCDAGRRGFIVAGLAGLGAAATLEAAPAAAASLTRAARDAMTPDQVIEAMLEGNLRFVSGAPRPRDLLAEVKTSSLGQYPAAIALSCVDSRAPVEVICDLGIGDTFNARLAGNVVNDDVLGSMEFACAAAGAKLVVVMGHTACGAVKGAIDGVELGNLTGLLAKIAPAIAATEYAGAREGANPDFVDAVAVSNVRLAVAQIREESPVLRALEEQGKIRVVGAMYDLATARVTLV